MHLETRVGVWNRELQSPAFNSNIEILARFQCKILRTVTAATNIIVLEFRSSMKKSRIYQKLVNEANSLLDTCKRNEIFRSFILLLFLNFDLSWIGTVIESSVCIEFFNVMRKHSYISFGCNY